MKPKNKELITDTAFVLVALGLVIGVITFVVVWLRWLL